MAIPVFNEGTMRYHDPDSGRMVKTPGNGAGAGSNLGASGSILEALNTHTLLLTDIKEGMFGTAAEQRDELIGREDTDIIDNLGDAGGSGKRKGMVETLKGMNPFSGGIGTKTMILLLVGALFAITKLGPKLVEPLSKFLQWVKEDAMSDISEGWEKLKEGFADKWNKAKEFFAWIRETFIPKVEALWGDLKEWYEEDWPKMLEKFTNLKTTVKTWWDEQWPKVEKFFDWIQGIWTRIGNYVDSFDVDNVEGLSPEERQKLIEDLGNKAKTLVGNILSSIWDNTNKWALAAFAVGGFATLAWKGVVIGSIAKWVAGGGSAATAGAGAPLLAKGVAGVATKLGLAGIVAGSLIGIFSAGRDAMTASIDEETGKLKFSDFAANFISGTGEGGWRAAIENAFTGGPTAAGALIGVGLGVAGGPMGMLMGGLAGAAIGGVIGGIAGYIGPDGIDSMIDGTVSLFKQAIDDISNFFGGFIAGVKGWVTGKGFTESRDMYLALQGDPEEQKSDIEMAEAEVTRLRNELENFEGSGPGKEAKRKALTAAINRLNALKKQHQETVSAFSSQSAENMAALPAMYAMLETLDPSMRGGFHGTNARDRQLNLIRAAEATLPGYMLNELRMQQASGSVSTGQFPTIIQDNKTVSQDTNIATQALQDSNLEMTAAALMGWGPEFTGGRPH